jgi:hypothetical protein
LASLAQEEMEIHFSIFVKSRLVGQWAMRLYHRSKASTCIHITILAPSFPPFLLEVGKPCAGRDGNSLFYLHQITHVHEHTERKEDEIESIFILS